MMLLEGALEATTDFFTRVWGAMGEPMFRFGSSVKSLPAVSQSVGGSLTVKGMELAGKVNTCALAKIGLACMGIGCVAVGAGLVVRTIQKRYSIRDMQKTIQSGSLIPLADGQKEPLGAAVKVMQKVKALFTSKVIPVVAGLSTAVAGVFVLAHAEHFSKALRFR